MTRGLGAAMCVAHGAGVSCVCHPRPGHSRVCDPRSGCVCDPRSRAAVHLRSGCGLLHPFMPRGFQVRVQVTEKFSVSNQAWVTKGRQQMSAEFQSWRHSASPEFSV